MKHTKIVLQSFILLLFCVVKTNAQEVLTLESAVKTALENNYEIKIATNNLTIEETNVAIGNAGMLPIVTANVFDNNSVQNSTQIRQDGTKNTLNNAKINYFTYGVRLDWTIFDGLRMFARLDQLKELQKLGEAQLKLTIITRISDVNAAYYDLVQQQQQLAALDTTLVISNQRLTLAQNRFTIGKASKLEVLNAQVDLNTDQVALLRQKELYANGKILLNQLYETLVSCPCFPAYFSNHTERKTGRVRDIIFTSYVSPLPHHPQSLHLRKITIMRHQCLCVDG